MKRTHRGLARLLSAGMSLALLTSLAPGATAASRNVEYEVDADEVLYLEKEDFDKFKFIYLILRNPCVFKENRHFNVRSLCIFPCFCPYEPKQGKLFV